MRCLGHITMSGDYDDTVDDIVKAMTAADALFTRCELIVHAQQPLTSLNSAIEGFIHDSSAFSP